jgi:hypothetical protein
MIRTTVIALDLALGAVVAVGALYAVAGGSRLSRDWLRGTPFTTFLWPGLVLLAVCGGSLLAAAGLLLAGAHLGRLVSVEAGVVLLGWSGLLLSAFGYRRWVLWLPVALGLVVVLLSFALPAPG